MAASEPAAVGKADARVLEAARAGRFPACFQCRKCSAGCPSAPWMSLLPHRLVRLVEQGRLDEVFASTTVWSCAECQTCVTRCPNDVDIPRVIESLRRSVLAGRAGGARGRAPVFVESFLGSVRKNGRVHELGLMRRYKMKTGDLFSDIGLGLGMFRRGKLKLFARKLKGRKDVGRIFEEALGGESA